MIFFVSGQAIGGRQGDHNPFGEDVPLRPPRGYPAGMICFARDNKGHPSKTDPRGRMVRKFTQYPLITIMQPASSGEMRSWISGTGGKPSKGQM